MLIPYDDNDIKYLDSASKEYLSGYEAAIEDIKTLRHNLDVYIDRLIVHMIAENDEEADELFEAIEDWMKMERMELVVSLIDNCEEWEENKARAEGGQDV